jgi:hypothetical protein
MRDTPTPTPTPAPAAVPDAPVPMNATRARQPVTASPSISSGGTAATAVSVQDNEEADISKDDVTPTDTEAAEKTPLGCPTPASHQSSLPVS